MSQAVNIPAVQWAYEQEELGVAGKAVLLTFAMHADNRGYTWPGTEFIASTWGLHKTTVRRQIQSLLVRRLIFRTKKRRGSTGQVKVYRMPKITWERGLQTAPFNDGKGAHKGTHKGRIRGAPVAPNNEQIDEQRTSHHDRNARGRSLVGTVNNLTVDLSKRFSAEYPSNDPHWPAFADHCARQGGKPTEAGFRTWKPSHEAFLRRKAQHLSPRKTQKVLEGEPGQMFKGKFYPQDEAIRLGQNNPKLLDNGAFKCAVRLPDGTVKAL